MNHVMREIRSVSALAARVAFVMANAPTKTVAFTIEDRRVVLSIGVLGERNHCNDAKAFCSTRSHHIRIAGVIFDSDPIARGE